MKINLINHYGDKSNSSIQQVLINRGIPKDETSHYLNTTDEDINSYESLGIDNLQEAAEMLVRTLQLQRKILVIVDSDCDGFTSSAILLNYLYKLFPSYIDNNYISWLLHTGKQHGLSDHIVTIQESDASLIIIPDAGTNDTNYCKQLTDCNKEVLILDHHLKEQDNPYAVIINNQCSDYPNKNLSGAGIVYQFCRYLDTIMNVSYADQFLDLCALGNLADVMSLRSIETKHLINKGLQPDNINNAFIYTMWQKNKFKLGEHMTYMGAAFYIAPFVNAMVRSGTQEEKELLFESMLDFKCGQMILSNKRGHKLGEQEPLVEQAVRVCTNVKNRQTREQDKMIDFFEETIQKDDMLKDKILLFTLEPNQVNKNIAGLIANKLANKYQRPCCILTSTERGCFEGSARGYERSGLENFKQLCQDTGLTKYTIGHENAFGLSIPQTKVNQFLNKTNTLLQDFSSETQYLVDFILSIQSPDLASIILELGDYEYLWGKDVEEPLLYITDIVITPADVTMMKANTLKLEPQGSSIPIIKFNSNDDEYLELINHRMGSKTLNAVCRANKNEWNNIITPQLILEDYEIVKYTKFYF